MPKTLTQISDEALQRKIQTSVLADDQKQELLDLLPQMSAEERNELIEMINHSIKEMVKADPELQKKVQEINDEYEHKLSELMHHQSHEIREQFEALDAKQAGKDTQALEGEMAGIEDTVSCATPAPKVLKSKKSHSLLRLVLILSTLAAIGGAALWGLKFL